MKSSYVLVGLFCLLLTSCVPDHLRKYRSSNSAASGSERTSEPASDIQATTRSARVARTSATAPADRPSIYAVDEKTFRFSLNGDEIWDAALNVLLRNYNLNIVDKESGVITTEWDTFFLNQDVFRNKVSLRVQRNSRSSADVMIHNSVEKLESSANSAGVGSIWLPSQESPDEIHRIIRNMAIVLNQPPPYIPSSNIASGEQRTNDAM